MNTFYGKQRDNKKFGKDSYERKRNYLALPNCLTEECEKKVRNKYTTHCPACIRKLNARRYYDRRQKYYNNPRYHADGKTHRTSGQSERRKL